MVKVVFKSSLKDSDHDHLNTSRKCIIRKSCAKRLQKGWRPLSWGMLCRSLHYLPFTYALEGIEIGRFFAYESPRGAIIAARERHEGRTKSDICVCNIHKIDPPCASVTWAFKALNAISRDFKLLE